MTDTKTKTTGTEETVLAFLKDRGPGGATAVEVAAAAAIHETTARRLLAALEATGVVCRERRGNSTTWYGCDPQTTNQGSPVGFGQGSKEVAQRRDDQVLEAARSFDSGVTVGDLAEKLDLSTSLTYLSLHRLRKRGDVKKIAPAKDAADRRAPRWIAS